MSMSQILAQQDEITSMVSVAVLEARRIVDEQECMVEDHSEPADPVSF